jgi:hypothetical protein
VPHQPFTRPTRHRLVASTLLTCFLVSLSILPIQARTATLPATPGAVTDSESLPPAWLEFGPNGQLMARVLVADDCPPIELDGVPSPMAPRTSPSPAFPVVACEATVPFGVERAAIDGQALNLPHAPFQRIAVIGDTGCRLSDWDKAYQACNDPAAWPFAQIAQSVAAWQPDLIVHVGDYLYRENACPDSVPGCQGSPFGDNWQTWHADFFAPVSPLLGSAPWVFMRGNHETCSRNPDGWFHYLDPRPYQADCQRFTDPYVIPSVGGAFAVIDSAEASDTTDSPDEVEAYRAQFASLAAMAPPGAWLITHRPMHGILMSQSGDIEVDNASYQAATGGNLGADYGLILSGHIHLAQSLAFDTSSGRPPQLISGNSGTALDDVPSATPTAQELGDARVREAENLREFGFLTLEPHETTWIAAQRDASAAPLVTCLLAAPEIACVDALPEN